MPGRERPLIVLLAAAETSASVLYGLYDVLVSVGAVFPDMTSGSPGVEVLDVRIATADGRPFRCVGNVPVEPHAALGDVETPDAIVVCDMYTPIETPPTGRYPREVDALRSAHAQGALVASVCTGSLLLAEAGLLDGRDAATHWAYRDLFTRCYPDVRLRDEQTLCLSSEADGIITAGGVTAWHDLAIHLIARFCGQRHALETAKVFLISGHAEGQSPYAVFASRPTGEDRVVDDAQQWLADNYAVSNPIKRMAERSGLTYRTFARRFNNATGHSPIEYLQALRVEEAKQMLEVEGMDVGAIAASVGYHDPTSFSRVFKRMAGLTPAAYRRKFAPPAASDGPRRPPAVRLQKG